MLPKLLLIIISILSSFIFSTYSYTQCLHHQQTLLLQLKNELIFNSSYSRKLVQWNERDECCKWYGVECDSAGYVVSLQLDDESIEGGIGDSSSLFGLQYLEKLNLAYNYFNYIDIPKGIHSLAYLTHLNLSNAYFAGQVPAEMLSIRRLVSLDISYNYVSIEYPNLEMLAKNLTGLRELYLDGVYISSFDERRKWSYIISSYLPNITTLSLCYCDLSTTVPDFFTNFSSLTFDERRKWSLSLAYCSLNGSFPNMIFHIPTLQYLDLSGNDQLSGSIPPFTQIGSLKSIKLSDTNFSGLIPSSISNLKTLEVIDLSSCQFTGSIPSTFANLTQLSHVDLSYNLFTGPLSSALFEASSNLVYLNLGYNSFIGYIPQSLFGLPLLQKLQLAENRFSGQVEEFHIVNVSNIVYLDLSRNRLEGPIPDSFFQLQSLYFLSLSDNLFNSTFQLDKIQSFTSLWALDLSNNKLSVDVGDINSSTYGPPQLLQLSLASCNMSDFPHIIKHSDLIDLDLSNNQIVGEIPSWIWGKELWHLNLSYNLFTDMQKPYHIPASLYLMDLRSNQLRGKLHIPPNANVQLLFLANNSFNGSIPTSLCSATNLNILDLSLNKLSGSIPPCLLDTTSLEVLDLGRNNITGRIPNKISPNCSLYYFDLNNNTLEGKIPKSLVRCNSLEFMNVGNNIINDTFPCMLSSTNLRFLVLHSNRFHGEVRCHNSWPKLQIIDMSSNNFSGSLKSFNFSSWMNMGSGLQSESYGEDNIVVTLTIKGQEQKLQKIWPDFNAIDFSCNNFQGEIPNAIGELHSLYALNFSHNALNGSIPKSFGELKGLESLDLSRNQLSGAIPMELAGLTFLSVLNLSYNKLVGMIPDGRQLQTFSADSFKGNPGLCGFNVNISCNHTNVNDLSPPDHENVEEKREIKWEYVSTALGYVVGLGSFVWLLLFCRSFRETYFGKVEEAVEEIFEARDRRRRQARRTLRNGVRRQ